MSGLSVTVALPTDGKEVQPAPLSWTVHGTAESAKLHIETPPPAYSTEYKLMTF